MHEYRRLIRYAWREWPTLLLILVLSGGSAAAAALQPLPLKFLVDYGLGAGTGSAGPAWPSLAGRPVGPMDWVALGALASLLLFLFNSALDLGLTWAWTAAGQRMVYDLAGDLFARLQRLSLRFHHQRSVGDLLSRLTGDTWCVYGITEALLVTPVTHLLTFATVGAVAWRLNPPLAALTMGMAPALAVSALFFGRRLKRRARVSREAQSRLTSLVHQSLTSIALVQAFAAERRNRLAFDEAAAQATAISQRQAALRHAFGLANGLATTVGTGLILYLGGRAVLSGQISVGSLLVLVGYLRSLQGAAHGLISVYANVKATEASIDRVSEVLDARERVQECSSPRALPARSAAEGRSVRFERVTFGYEPGYAVLRDVSLEAMPGETVAIVGRTGAGKSTLMSLLLRLLDPWEGRILVDGVDLRDVRLRDLRGEISIVLQEPFLLPLTVAQNIAYGRPGVRRAAVVAAAEAANADEFIRQLPGGYDTVIGERGATLSGGQKQRLAIARALVRDAPVLVLDEPTAALDAAAESCLMQAVGRLLKGRTTFIIAHRLSTVRQANRIVVLDGGAVAETGVHAELMARQGLYRQFYTRQFPEAEGGLS